MSGPATTVQPTGAELDQLARAYDEGQFLDAWAAIRHCAPLRAWRGPAAMVWAGRLSSQLGGSSLGDSLLLAAARWYPEDQRVQYFGLRALLSRRGPLEAWRTLARWDESRPDLVAQPEVLGLKAVILGIFQDFREAQRTWDLAWRARPEDLWLLMERSVILEQQDRFDDSIAVLHDLLDRRPWYCPAVLSLAQAWLARGQRDEAIDLLTRAMSRLQSPWVAGLLANALIESDDPQGAMAAWDRYGSLATMLEPDGVKALLAALSQTYYLAGDLTMARRFAEQSDDPFLGRIAARLAGATSAGRRRVVIEVPVVRQHRVTCAPATLEMLGGYWQRRVDQLVIADEITYNGTPTHLERGWAERNGWVGRELSLDWAAATALLDRGVPFTLTTRGPLSAHEQAVVGYDEVRRTLLVRDPSSPFLVEWDIEGLLENQRAHGPRALALVPTERANLLEGLVLGDAQLRDELYRMMQALEGHDRAAAVAALGRLDRLGRQSPVALEGRCLLARYDDNLVELLAAIEAQLELFPDDPLVGLQRLECLAALERRQECHDELTRQIDRGGHPVFLRLQARELATDGERFAEARECLRRYLQQVPTDPEGLELAGQLLWSERKLERAHAYLHLAACLGDTNERLFAMAFRAAELVGAEDRSIDVLRERFERSGRRSAAPAQTLFWALLQRGESHAAFEVLDRALELRPADGDLRLFAADAHARIGRYERAEQLAAGATVSRRDRVVVEARIAGYRGELAAAARLWREALALNPHDLAGLDALRTTIGATEGQAAALELLRGLVRQSPHHLGLRRLLIEELREDGPEHEAAIRELLVLEPRDAWARRELALALGARDAVVEAHAELDLAEAIDPDEASTRCIRARLSARAGDLDTARALYLEAVRLDPDSDLAIGAAAATCPTAALRREVLEVVFAELSQRPLRGEGITAFMAVAEQTLAADELLAHAEVLAARHDRRWQAWVAVVRCQTRLGLVQAALETAGEAVRRFPAVVEVLVEAAQVHREATGWTEPPCPTELELLRAAVAVEPTSAQAALALAASLRRGGRGDEVSALLEEAIVRIPLDGRLSWMLADEQAAAGRLGEALASYERAARLAPWSEELWQNFRAAAEGADRPGLPREVARRLVAERPLDLGAAMAVVLVEDDPAARLEAVEGALRLDPRHEPAHDLQAVALAEDGRIEEARTRLEAVPGFSQSVVLRGRRAWIDARAGDLAGAIRAMKLVVEDDPAYAWGWLQLASWAAAAERPALQLRAADEMLRLDARDTAAWCHRGDALRGLGQSVEAVEAYERAHALEPEHPIPILGVADAWLDADEYGEAQAWVARIEDPTDALARSFAIALHTNDAAAALATYERAVTDAEIADGLADYMIGRLQQAELGDKAIRRLDRGVEAGTLLPRGIWHWAQLQVPGGWKKVVAMLPRLIALGPAFAAAALRVLVEHAAETGRWSDFDRLLKRHADLLVADRDCWSAVGFGLARSARWRRCREWLSGPNKPEPFPFTLYNLALAHRFLGETDEAAAVACRGLDLPADHTTPRLCVWAAYDAAIAGRITDASSLLDSVDPGVELSPLEMVAVACTEAMAAAALAGDDWHEAARGELTRVKRSIKAMGNDGATKKLALGLARQAVVAMIGRHGGGDPRRWWRWCWSGLLWNLTPG